MKTTNPSAESLPLILAVAEELARATGGRAASYLGAAKRLLANALRSVPDRRRRLHPQPVRVSSR
jgi:hypothetical protein